MSDPIEAPRAERPSERAALAVRPCARNIHAALKRANLTVKGVRVTTGANRCKVDLTSTLEGYGPERARQAEDAIRGLWNDHSSRVVSHVAGRVLHVLYIRVDRYWQTAPLDLVELCHAAALREDEGRTPAPVTASAEFWPGLRLRNPHTGASYEVIEHTHAVRLRNHRTGTVVAIPQEMARKLERLLPEGDGYLDRVRDIRVRCGKRETERLHEQMRLGLQRLTAVVADMPRVLTMFVADVERASVALAKAFPMSHPNACDLCGDGLGERDHPGLHAYEPPSDATRLGRMVVRRLVDAPARERIHAAHVKWRRAVNLRLLYERPEREAPAQGTRTELERAGLTTVPFDQQRVQADPSAFSLPS